MDYLTKWLRFNLLSILILSGASAFGVELEPKMVRDFSAGLITDQDSTLIPDGAAQDLENVDVDSGSIEKRRGSTLQNSTALADDSAVKFVGSYYSPTTNTGYLIAIASQSLYSSTDLGVSNALLSSSLGVSSTSIFSSANALSYLWIVDGTTNPILTNGTTVTRSTSAPIGGTIAFWAGRIWIGSGSTLYGSKIGDGTDWTQDSGLDSDAFSATVRSANGYNIRAIVPFGRDLFVFKDRSIDRVVLLSDGQTYQLLAVSDSIGTAYAETVAVGENKMLWLGHDGVYSYNGSTIIRESESIHNTVLDIKQLFPATSTAAVDTSSDFAAGTLGASMSTTSVSGEINLVESVFDDFSDNEYTTNPTWTASTNGAGSTVTVSGGVLSLTVSPTSGSNYARISSSISAENLIVITTTSFSSSAESSLTIEFSTKSTFSPAPLVIITTGGYNITGLGSGSFSPALSVNTSYKFSFEYIAGVLNFYVNGSLINSGAYNLTSAVPKYFRISNTNATTKTFDSVSYNVYASTYISAAIPVSSQFVAWLPTQIEETLETGTSSSYVLYTDTDTSMDINTASSYVSSQTFTNGSVPTVSRQNYIRFVSRLGRSSLSYTPHLKLVKFSWLEGGSTFRPAATYHDGRYYLAIGINSTSVNDTIIILDKNMAWTKYTGLPVYYFGKLASYLFFGANNAGDIVRMQVDDRYRDYNDAAISAFWIGKDQDLGYPITTKSLLRYYLTAEYTANSTLTASYGVDRGSLTSVTYDLDSTSGFFRQTIKPSSLTYGEGIQHRFKVSNSVIDEYFKILSVTGRWNLNTNP